MIWDGLPLNCMICGGFTRFLCFRSFFLLLDGGVFGVEVLFGGGAALFFVREAMR